MARQTRVGRGLKRERILEDCREYRNVGEGLGRVREEDSTIRERGLEGLRASGERNCLGERGGG